MNPKVLGTIIAFLILLALVGVTAIEKRVDANKKDPARWQEIARFQGNGDKTTNPIETGGSFRIRYIVNSDSDMAAFGGSIKGIEDPTKFGSFEFYGAGEGETYFYGTQQKYYINIITANLDSWEIIVEEER